MKEIVAKLHDRFPGAVLDFSHPNERRAYLTVPPDQAPAVCWFLHADLGGRLAIITGVDTRAGIELLYHMMFSPRHLMVTVRTTVPTPEPRIASLGADYTAALWAERELADILGVAFEGHPDPRRLIMADDWPEHIHPLRRDFTDLDTAQARFRNPEGDRQ